MSETAESVHFFPDPSVVNLNHAGASPCSDATLGCILRHFDLERKVGGYKADEMMRNKELPQVYQSIANLIHANDVTEIALVESATVAWTRFFYAAAQYQWEQSQDSTITLATNDSSSLRIILVSEADYAANVSSICHWCNTHGGWHALCIPSIASKEYVIPTTGKVDLQKLDDMLKGLYWYYNSKQEKVWLDPKSIAMVCVAHIPTNSGIVNPVEDIGAMIASYNKNYVRTSSSAESYGSDRQQTPRIFYFVDACQSVGQRDVNVQKIQCHGLAATGRKYLRGPRGTGFLYVSNAVVKTLRPNHADHYSTPVEEVPVDFSCRRPLETQLKFLTRPGARRFEFWESSIALKLAFGCAVTEVMQFGVSTISDIILQRSAELYEKLQVISKNCSNRFKLCLYHRPESGIVTFWIDGLDANKIEEYFWNVREERIDSDIQFAVSVVPATSTPMDSSSSAVPNMIRASVSYTTTTQEIDLFCKCLANLLR